MCDNKPSFCILDDFVKFQHKMFVDNYCYPSAFWVEWGIIYYIQPTWSCFNIKCSKISEVGLSFSVLIFVSLVFLKTTENEKQPIRIFFGAIHYNLVGEMCWQKHDHLLQMGEQQEPYSWKNNANMKIATEHKGDRKPNIKLKQIHNNT